MTDMTGKVVKLTLRHPLCHVQGSRRSGVPTAVVRHYLLSLTSHLPSTEPNYGPPAAAAALSPQCRQQTSLQKSGDRLCQGGRRGVEWRSTHEGRQSQLKLIGNKRALGVSQCEHVQVFFLFLGPISISTNRHFVTFCLRAIMF